MQIENEEVKLFAENMIIYAKNPKESTQKGKKKLLQWISVFSKVNIQKLIVSLYSSSEKLEIKILKYLQ